MSTLKLVTAGKEFSKTIKGHKVVFRTLTNGQKQGIADKISEFSEDSNRYDAIMIAVAVAVVSIEGAPKNADMEDVLPRIEDIEIQTGILNAVLDKSSLSKAAKGN